MKFTIECMACGGPMRRVWAAHLGERYRCETCKAVEDVPGDLPFDSDYIDALKPTYDIFVLTPFDKQFLRDCGISI